MKLTLLIPMFLVLMAGFAYAMESVVEPKEISVSQIDKLENYLTMARIAQFAYKDPATVKNGVIEDHSEFLGTFDELKQALDKAEIEYIGSMTVGINNQIRVVAFYDKKTSTMLYSIRGTVPTNFANILADAGIGRLKSNDELLRSFELAQQNLAAYGVANLENTELAFNVLRAVIAARVTSVNPYLRPLEPLYKGTLHGIKHGLSFFKHVATKPLSSVTGKATSLLGVTAGGTTTLLGASATTAVSAPTIGAAGLMLLSTWFGATGLASFVSGTFEGTKETVKAFMTVNDGYEHLIDHIKLTHKAVLTLQARAEEKGLEVNNSLWIGHSLGGYLATFCAMVSNGKALVFNAPGLCTSEAACLAYQASIVTDQESILKQQQEMIDRIVHIRNQTCTIALLGDRDGTVIDYCRHSKEALKEEKRLDKILLEEHGIDTMIETLKLEIEKDQQPAS